MVMKKQNPKDLEIIMVIVVFFHIVCCETKRSFPEIVLTATMNRKQGIKFHGISSSDFNGYSVSNAGDVNGDGYDDALIGAPYADPSGTSSGETYLIFGGSDIVNDGSFDLNNLNGSNGFVLNGVDSFDYSGRALSGAGDVNGDGYDDFLIGAYAADGSGSLSSGESYLVFGSSSIGSSGSISLEDLDGYNGFVIYGTGSGEYSGVSVSGAGDFNNDGFSDILIGAYAASSGGATYLIFGGFDIGNNGTVALSELSGSRGFVMRGVTFLDLSGISVSSAGDFNGDGYDDVIIGASGVDPNGKYAAGASYIVYGGSNVGKNGTIYLSFLDGGNGFVVNGIDEYDYAGRSVSSAGDFNGDGYDDVIIGASGADPNYYYSAGESYIVFGGSNVGITGIFELNDLDGNNGVIVEGDDGYDYSGCSVSGAGDVNGDGYDDVVIGAYWAEFDASDADNSGESYVVFGGPSVGIMGIFELGDMNGKNGFRIIGEDADDYSGFAVGGGGDFNGDGYDDVIVGAHGGGSTGEAYIILNADSSSSSAHPNDPIGAIIGGVLGGVLVLGCLLWGLSASYTAGGSSSGQDRHAIQLQHVSDHTHVTNSTMDSPQLLPVIANPLPIGDYSTTPLATFSMNPENTYVTASVVSVDRL